MQEKSQAIKQQILTYIKDHGPSLPKDLLQAIQPKVDSIILGALLADLTSKQQLKTTKIKFKGSVYYYLPGQEEQLQTLAELLAGPEKEAYQLLKEQAILAEAAIVPRIRVALQQLKDYARRIGVTHEGNVSYFWCWYLLDQETIKEKIKALLLGNQEQVQKREPSQEPQKEQEKKKEKKEQEEKQREERNDEKNKANTKEKDERLTKEATLNNEEKQMMLSELPIINAIKRKGISIKDYEPLGKKELKIEGWLPTQIGKIPLLIIVKRKKLTTSDLLQLLPLKQKHPEKLLLVLAEGISKKTPAKELGILVQEVKTWEQQ